MQPEPIASMQLIGSLDRLDNEIIEGWLTAQNAPHLKIPLEVRLDGEVIGRFTADGFRQDLADAGIGQGTCAFRFEMPAFVPSFSLARLEVAITGSPLVFNVAAKLPPLVGI